jgi:hypothetical protein
MPMSEKRFNRKLEKIKKQGERYKQEKELRDAYAQYVPDKKKKKVSNIMLVIVVIATTLYAVANFWLTYKTGINIDSTLTTCFYALWSGELLGLVTIKIGKVVKGYDKEEVIHDYVDDENSVG